MDASQRNLYETFIGERNSDYYLKKFESFDKLGGGLHASFNWPAFISPAWALYRKMYGWFFAMWFITAVMSGFAKVTGHFFLVIVPIMAFSAFANSLYHRHVKIKIAQAEKGGVNMWVPWVAASLPVIGILAAIVIPAMTSAPKAVVPAVAPQVEANPFDEFDAPAKTAVNWTQYTPVKQPGLFDDVLAPAAVKKPLDFSRAKRIGDVPENWTPAPQVNRFLTPPAIHPAFQAWKARNPWFRSNAHVQATRRTIATYKQMIVEGYRFGDGNFFGELDQRLLKTGITK